MASAFETRAENEYLNELLGEEKWEDWAEHAASEETLERAREASNDG